MGRAGTGGSSRHTRDVGYATKSATQRPLYGTYYATIIRHWMSDCSAAHPSLTVYCTSPLSLYCVTVMPSAVAWPRMYVAAVGFGPPAISCP